MFLHEELNECAARRRIRRVGIRTGGPCFLIREVGKVEVRAAQLLVLQFLLVDQRVVLDALRQSDDRILPAGRVEQDADEIRKIHAGALLLVKMLADLLEQLLVVQIAVSVEQAGSEACHLAAPHHSLVECFCIHLTEYGKHLFRHEPDELFPVHAAGEEAEAAQVVEPIVLIAERLRPAAICRKIPEELILLF